MNDIDKIANKVERDIALGKIKRKLTLGEWLFVIMVVLILSSMVWVFSVKFMRINTFTCNYYPYLTVEYNSTGNISAIETSLWNSNLTVPDDSSLCLGEKINSEVVNESCIGNTLQPGVYNVTCREGAFYKEDEGINNSFNGVICYVIYNCTTEEVWRWNAHEVVPEWA